MIIKTLPAQIRFCQSTQEAPDTAPPLKIHVIDSNDLLREKLPDDIVTFLGTVDYTKGMLKFPALIE